MTETITFVGFGGAKMGRYFTEVVIPNMENLFRFI